MMACDRCGEAYSLDFYHIGPMPDHRVCPRSERVNERVAAVRDYPPYGKKRWWERADGKRYGYVIFSRLVSA